MEHLMSSFRVDDFPVGLRVLVIDYDLSWLEILVKMLKKCAYKVLGCSLGLEALKLLHENKEGFDLVISDVNMPDMDGFKLMEAVSLETGIPVIMMSEDGDTSRVMKGVQHGASEFVLKPISFKELKTLLQHMMRKRMYDLRETEDFDYINGISGLYHFDDKHELSDQAMNSPNKRKGAFEGKFGNMDATETPSPKKARVIWSVELHEKFVKAVEQLGCDKVGPKKILDLMNVSWLTRENVASHLQKYRLYLGRQNSKTDAKQSDDVLNGGNFTVRNRADRAISGSFVFPGSGQVIDASKRLGQTRSSDTRVADVEDKPASVGRSGHLSKTHWSDTPSSSLQIQDYHLQGLLPNELHPPFADARWPVDGSQGVNFECDSGWETSDMLPPPLEIEPEYYYSSHTIEPVNESLRASLDSDESDCFYTNSIAQNRLGQHVCYSTEIPATSSVQEVSGQDDLFSGMCAEILATLCEEWPMNNDHIYGSMDSSVFQGLSQANP